MKAFNSFPLNELISKYLFYEYSHKRVSLIRVLFYSLVFCTHAIFTFHYYDLWVTLPYEMWAPVGFSLLINKIPSYEFVGSVYNIWLVVTLFCVFGLFTKFMSWIWFLIAFYLSSLRLSFGEFSHEYQVIVILGFLLAVNRTNVHYSIDSLIFSKKNKVYENKNGWLIQTAKLYFVIIFFSAGYSKLFRNGIDWFATDNVANWMIYSNHYYLSLFARDLAIGPFLAQNIFLCSVIGFLGVTLEILSPLILSKKYSYFILALFFAFQTANYFLFTRGFFEFLALYIFWIPNEGTSIEK